MKNSISILILVFLANLAIAAQQSGAPATPPPEAPSSAPPPSSGNSSALPGAQPPQRQAQIVNRSINMARERQMQALREMELQMLSMSTADNLLAARSDVTELYRKTNKKDLKVIGLNPDDSAKYSVFLQQKNTGLVKLMPNLECDKDSKVVVATDKCLKYNFPGAGASYSFRFGDYRVSRLSDLVFDSDSFQSDSVWTQGILVAVGDVPLEQINLENAALKYLVEFQPVTDQEKAIAVQQDLRDGVKSNGFIYAQALTVKENMTYALRSVAYKGKYYRQIKGVTYDELAFDKRKDVIVGFRVIRKDSDGSVTILWKEVSSKDSPKLTVRKEKTQKGN